MILIYAYKILGILCGAAALVLAVLSIFKGSNTRTHFCSMGFCGAAVTCVLRQVTMYARMEDLSPFLDGIERSSLLATCLLTATILLNAYALNKKKG